MRIAYRPFSTINDLTSLEFLKYSLKNKRRFDMIEVMIYPHLRAGGQVWLYVTINFGSSLLTKA